jgi:hypothetical protein
MKTKYYLLISYEYIIIILDNTVGELYFQVKTISGIRIYV